jgi:proline dehydrogenase
MPYGFERRLAGRWIAGPDMDDALRKAKEINRRWISVVINFLGEDFARKADVQEAVDTYLALMARMAGEQIHGDISLKPSQIGLGISYNLMKENYVKIMEKARMGGIFVWLDMEEPRHVDATIRMYLEMGRYARGGICIQAYLKRSREDVKVITREGGTVRLVKGAYVYKEGTGMIKRRDEIGANYRKIMHYLFEHSPRFTIATHDLGIVKEALALNTRQKKDVTYAMRNGINNGAAKELAAKREKVALYLPFGTRWIGYSYRRLREIGHIRLIIGSLFVSQKL